MGGCGTLINCYMNWTMEMLLPQNKFFQLFDEWKEKSSKCRVISLSMLAKQLNYFIWLSRCACSNIVWCYTYSREWNDVSKVSAVNKTDPRFSVTIGVSGSWCCATFFNTQSLFFPWHSCINRVCMLQPNVGIINFAVQIISMHFQHQNSIYVNLQCPSSGGSVPYY